MLRRFVYFLCLHVFVYSFALGQGSHFFNGAYKGLNNERIAFPVGGIGAGMICLEGTGAISHVSLRHNPDLFHEPLMFAAIAVKGKPGLTRVLEGPVPGWKKFGLPGTGGGLGGTSYGLPRFQSASFRARFPFGEVALQDASMPVQVTITGWSPFIPTDADNSSLPVGGLEYHFKNNTSQTVSYIFSYNAANFMALEDSRNPGNSGIPAGAIRATEHGFILSQDGTPSRPDEAGYFAVVAADPATVVDHCWYRGGWWDPLSMAWKKIVSGTVSPVSPVSSGAPGASLYIPFILKPGETKVIPLMLAWYAPDSRLRNGIPPNKSTDSTFSTATSASRYYKPWYSSRFTSIGEVIAYWKTSYDKLRANTEKFTTAFYRSSLAPEITEAVAANLTTLKSPTVLRQYDGRFWGWEGSNDADGSCAGNCTHVWDYAQALPHLFPSLERTIRETELGAAMDSFGHQNYRAALPIRAAAHNYYLPAADGQLGAIMRLYRDWRISGDSAWLAELWPRVKVSLDYGIRTWDPRHTGTLEEPQHNTYDIEFWGANGMTTSIYLGALEAFISMSDYLGEDASGYKILLEKGKAAMEHQLYNGSYFIQKIAWSGLNASDPLKDTADRQDNSLEAIELLKKEGPEYQYGTGCLSDGVIGCWIATVCGLPEPVDRTKIISHLQSVYRYNLKKDLSGYANPQRPGFALGKEGGLLLCSWPRGGQLSLPFVYSNEVWTGVEYEVASHLIFEGKVTEGLDIVRTCRRRYDGRIRNPFDEYEAGHWYARAMSSYALIEACTGARYDAVTKTLYVQSRVGDFTSFLSTDTGFGNVIYKHGKVTLDVVFGKIKVNKIMLNP